MMYGILNTLLKILTSLYVLTNESSAAKSLVDSKGTEKCPQTNYEFLNDEIRSYITVSKPISSLQQISLCGWFTNLWEDTAEKIDKIYLVDYSNRESLRAFSIFFSDDKMHIIVNNQKNYFNPPEAGTNYHLCVTADVAYTGRSVVYINGKEWGSFLVRVEEIKGDGALRIGQSARGFSRFSYKGDVRNLMIWDRVLSDTEIQVMYSSPSHFARDCILSPSIDDVELQGAVKRDPKIPACPTTAYNFSNYDDRSYIEVSNPFSNLGRFSICGWFTHFWNETIPHDARIFLVAYEDRVNFFAFSLYYTKEYMYIWINNRGTRTELPVLESGTEYHLCVTTDAKWIGESEAYVNGKSLGYFTGKAGVIEGGGTLRIGQSTRSFATYSYQGSITNFMMWDRLLPDREVEDMFRNPSYFPAECTFAPTEDKIKLQGSVSAILLEE